MRIGISIPQLGALADPAAVNQVAIEAEAAGYDSLWAIDRLLAPIRPRSAYPASPDGALPAEHHRVLDPLVVLTHAAAVTERVRLGTNVLVAPWYSPVPLARSLTSLDLLSAGRLTVGFGIGWSIDEYEATTTPFARRGAQLEELLDVLHHVWTDDVVEHDGGSARIASCTIEPKPCQRPHPPVLLAAFTSAGFDRIARRADGWLPVAMPADVVAATWAGIREAAEGYGRNPDALQLVVRATVKVTTTAMGGDRAPFTGTIPQIAADVGAIADAGAHEVIIDVHADARTADEALDLTERIVTTAGVRAGHHTLTASPS